MSGGSWDYISFKVDEAVDRLLVSHDPLRRAFGKQLKLCAKALHDIEWVDSNDTSPGDERPAIEAALGVGVHALELAEVQQAIEVLIAQYQELKARREKQK